MLYKILSSNFVRKNIVNITKKTRTYGIAKKIYFLLLKYNALLVNREQRTTLKSKNLTPRARKIYETLLTLTNHQHKEK